MPSEKFLIFKLFTQGEKAWLDQMKLFFNLVRFGLLAIVLALIVYDHWFTGDPYNLGLAAGFAFAAWILFEIIYWKLLRTG